MYRYVPTVALVVGFIVLGVLGARGTPDAPADEGAVAPSATPAPPSDATRPAPVAPVDRRRRVVRFARPEAGAEDADPTDTKVIVVRDPAPLEPPAGRRTLDDLSDAARERTEANAMERLAELVDRCEDTVPDGALAMAEIVLDEHGLFMADVAAYNSAPGEPLVPSLDPPPPALVGCLEDTLWDGDWEPMEPGTSVAFVLSMDLAPTE